MIDFPRQIIAGDTLSATVTVPDYPASSWTLTLYVKNKDHNFTVSSSADGDKHVIASTAAESALYEPGAYQWSAVVDNGTERYTVDTGSVRVAPDPTLNRVEDTRTTARRTYDAICAMLEGKASSDQQSLSVNGRSLSRYSFSELIEARSHFANIVRNEADRKRAARGLPTSRMVGVRFGRYDLGKWFR